MFRRLCVIFLLLVASSAVLQPAFAAVDSDPLKSRLIALYRETFHQPLEIDEATLRLETVEFEGREIEVAFWSATTSHGAAIAFVAPDVASVVGVIHLGRDTVDLWQLRGAAPDSPVDLNVVGFPLSQRSGIGVGDLICGGVTGLIGGLLCVGTGPGVLACGAAAGVGGTVFCGLFKGDEQTGRLQPHFKEDDPLGLKGYSVIYDESRPMEGVWYNGESFLCGRSTNSADRTCYRPRQTGPSTITMDPVYTNFKSRIKWSDGSSTMQYFSTWRWDFWPDVVFHQSDYLSNIGPYYIRIKTEQQVVLPTGETKWVWLDTLSIHTATCDRNTFCL